MARCYFPLHFLTTLFLFLAVSSLPSRALTVEIQALLYFKNQLKDPLNSLASWKDTESPCDFIGISCDQISGRVIGISLEGKSLCGEISPSISALQSLSSLMPPWNSISGELPLDLINCSNLRVLNLTGNDLKGTIPDLSALTSLEILDLSFNYFSGGFPVWVGKLTNLVSLGLGQNDFEDSKIPENLGNLKNLKWFFLAGANLQGEIPEPIFGLKALQTLDFSSNILWGEISKAISNLQSLYKIELFSNNFTGGIPPEENCLQGLGICRIWRPFLSTETTFPENLLWQFLLALANDFSGDFPESYAECKTLERFRVSKNHLSGKIADGIWGLPSAKIIDFGDNGFSGGISSDIRISVNLNQLFLQNNRFSGVLPSELGRLFQLEKLSASNNSFSGEIPYQIEDMKQLSSLHLEENSLSGSIPSELGQCTGLVDLNFAGNSLTGSIPDTLTMLNSLNSLNLSQNKLSGLIPENLEKLKLSSIDFSENQLSGRIPSDLLVMGGDQAFLENMNLCIDQRLRNETRTVISVCNGNLSTNIIAENKLALLYISSVLVLIFAGFLFVYSNHESYLEDLEKGQDPNWKLESFHPTQFNADEIVKLL
ncbi:hypothetical protein NE237_017159 [Protea cynaroides]|uniref:Leucine-rich repeat-containing N-terminal plant-type domain-containing protein n=1 Tax=Protea cynaroides TaxID=273540 RepID=A0A9Q0QML7_9MAGN|nr:hypothetical protein NE237_017159 [Protea cynaroides]